VKWANAVSILTFALSGGIFLLVGTGLTSANDSSSTPITVIDANGGRALLDTLLPAGEAGLIVIADNRETRDIVTDDAVNAGTAGPELAEPKPAPSKSSKQMPSKSSKTAPSNTADSPCININTAAEADLITIKGVGPATAAKIIEYRAQKGKFRKKEDILNVKGIGPAKFAQMEGRICL